MGTVAQQNTPGGTVVEGAPTRQAKEMSYGCGKLHRTERRDRRARHEAEVAWRCQTPPRCAAGLSQTTNGSERRQSKPQDVQAGSVSQCAA